MPKPRVTIYTDGGCQPNPGPGGWAAILLEDGQPRELSGSAPDSTNNRMEITAALEALRSLAEPSQVELITDSTYLKNGITQWISGWRRRGWLTASKQPVKNQDLWKALDEATRRHQIQWRWTKGHAGNRWNERADELATAARGGGRPEPQPNALPLAREGVIHAFLGASWSGKSRRGGWGCLLSFDGLEKELSGQVLDTTANAVHLAAADSALAALKRPLPVHLYTVSDYLQRGATTWLAGWKRNHWQTASGKPVASRDRWQDLDLRISRLEREGHRIDWHLVSGDDPPEMERARELARAAQRGGSK